MRLMRSVAAAITATMSYGASIPISYVMSGPGGGTSGYQLGAAASAQLDRGPPLCQETGHRKEAGVQRSDSSLACGGTREQVLLLAHGRGTQVR